MPRVTHRVHVGRVYEVAPRLHEPVQQGKGGLLVAQAGVGPRHREGHCAQA